MTRRAPLSEDRFALPCGPLPGRQSGPVGRNTEVDCFALLRYGRPTHFCPSTADVSTLAASDQQGVPESSSLRPRILHLASLADLTAGYAIVVAAGQYDRVIAEFRRALEIIAGSPRAHFELGATFMLVGRSRDAIGELEAAVGSVGPRGQSEGPGLSVIRVRCGRPVARRPQNPERARGARSASSTCRRSASR